MGIGGGWPIPIRYFDGLNRFYVADEHGELMESLKVPPNIFDEIVFVREIELQASHDATVAEFNHVCDADGTDDTP